VGGDRFQVRSRSSLNEFHGKRGRCCSVNPIGEAHIQVFCRAFDLALVRYDRTPSALSDANRDVQDLYTQGQVPSVVLTRDEEGVVVERGRLALRALVWAGRAQRALGAEFIAFGNDDEYTHANTQNDFKLGSSSVRSGNLGVLVG
jgi:hypothetical protein